MSLKSDSFLLAHVSLLAVASLLTACERKCPSGTALLNGGCIKVVQTEQGVMPASAAGSGVPAGGGTAGTAAARPGSSAATETAAPSSGSMQSGMAMRSQTPGASNPSAPSTSATSDAGAATSADNGEPANDEPVVVCSDGELQCSTAMLGTLETCVGGQWAQQPCAAEEMCLDAADGARCVLPVEACAGRDGENVCTDAGEMLACLPGGEAMTVATCTDAALCKAGIAAGACAQCVPGTHQCNGQALETCDAQGQGFALQDSCASAALCDAKQGRCTAPKCEAEQHVCEGSALKKCNQDLTPLESVRQCLPGLCDEENRTCRMCMPGQARCGVGGRQQCDEQGQSFAAAACPEDTPVCAGAGESVQCGTTRDCAPRACHVASCGSRQCTYRPTPSSDTGCRYSEGQKIRPGGVDGPGLIYVIVAGAAWHIYTAEDLNGNFGGLSNLMDTTGSGAPCTTRPKKGVNLRETDDNRIGHIGEDGRWHHIVNGDDFTNNCGGRVLLIPAGGLMRNGVPIGDSV